ncbi:unnamed protein product [Brassica rapa]|uniref:Uncharacterized protein n=2 Tax=Brassica campestris TaxID=3711 RepID=A0A3P5Z682_BRACM|nr:unnamed protein product [Brassica rapa]VDC75527.1 unnamed protein product [Brassica rapa]
MGNCIHTMRSKHGNLVRDLSLDDASTKKIKESPQLEVAEQKTGKRRCVKIILTRKQLEQLLLKCPEGVSFKLPETYGSCNRKWKPSLHPIVEFSSWILLCKSCIQKKILVICKQLSYSPSPFLSPHQQVMDIQARLMDYKFHFMVAIIVSVVMSSLVYAAPRVLDILAYFWPLFASTAAFLAIAITFGGFQQLSDEATGEGIMDYVAGRPDDSHKYN